jgi:N6-L-threonylcarbamoyladenine synthase
LAGGVAANSEIRSSFMQVATKYGIEGFIPDFQYCTDNAAMIAMVGHFDLTSQKLSGLGISTKSNLSL